MLWKRMLLICSTLLLIGHALGTVLAASKTSLEVSAADTPRLKTILEGKKVSAMFSDGTWLTGRVREVRSDSLLMLVQSSEDASALSNGEQSIPIKRFSALQITQYRGKMRAILTSSLLAGGFAAGFFAGLESDFETTQGKAAAVLLPTAGGLGGYFLGKSLDKQELTILIK
jgi:hypothetical protein